MWISITSAGVSVMALLLSAITLWRNHLAPDQIVTSAGPMSMCIHRMRSESGESWLLPHFAVSTSFTNSGARIGRVQAIRLVVRYPSLPITDAHEIFTCHGEYNHAKYRQHGHRRFAMIEKALLGDFIPLVILPKNTTTHFYVFDSRWDRPVRQRGLIASVEFKTNRSSNWVPVDMWKYYLDSEQSWESLEKGSRLSTEPINSQQNHRYARPNDLHKYTRDSEVTSDQSLPIHSVQEITSDPIKKKVKGEDKRKL